MTIAWDRRPLEMRVHQNPALVALLIRQVVAGYRDESDCSLPAPLAFIAIPILLARPIRDALPTIATSLPIWIQTHPLLRERFPEWAASVVPAVREGLVIGLSTGLLRLTNGDVTLGLEPHDALRATPTTSALGRRAHFVGRWFARAGDVSTIYILWGVRP